MYGLSVNQFIATIIAISAATSIILYLIINVRTTYLRTRNELTPIEITNTPEASMQVWQAVYQQSAETLRDQAKVLASLNIAGLAGAIAILSGNKTLPESMSWLIASALLFSAGLVFSVMPIASLADKFKEDLSSVMNAMKDQTKSTIQIRHAFATGTNFYAVMLTLSILGGGVFCLTKALY